MLLNEFNILQKSGNVFTALKTLYGIELPKSQSVEKLKEGRETAGKILAKLKEKNCKINDKELLKYSLMYEAFDKLIKEANSDAINIDEVFETITEHLLITESDEEIDDIANTICDLLEDYYDPNSETSYVGDKQAKAAKSFLGLADDDDDLDKPVKPKFKNPHKVVKLDKEARKKIAQALKQFKQTYKEEENMDTGKILEAKESYVKQLRTLVEGEIEQAEVIMASKSFSQDLQDMIEKVGRLMNEDLGPVVDQMRDTFGSDVSSVFSEMMSNQLQEVIDELRDAKDKIDSSVEAIATGRLPTNNDMERASIEKPAVDAKADAEADDVIADPEQEIDEPLGREAKESAEDKRKALEEKIKKLEEKVLAAREKAK